MSAVAPFLWLSGIAPATQAAWIDAHAAWLSPRELARWQRITRPERRAQFLAGHVLLRRLVAARTVVPPQHVVVSEDASGRPMLTMPAGFHASLAHSGPWVAALLANDAEVGVDIEFMRSDRQIESIVRVACGVDAGSREQAYLTWAQREAEIKAGIEGTPVWTVVWRDHALAVCASALPEVAVVDLADAASVLGTQLPWTSRPPLPVASTIDGR